MPELEPYINKNFRNAAIILLIAAAVYAIPAADTAFGFLTELIALAFLAAFAWICSRLYREHRMEIEGLGTRNRAAMYVAIGVATLTLIATGRLWASGLGTIVWLALLAGCGYTLYLVFRASRTY